MGCRAHGCYPCAVIEGRVSVRIRALLLVAALWGASIGCSVDAPEVASLVDGAAEPEVPAGGEQPGGDGGDAETNAPPENTPDAGDGSITAPPPVTAEIGPGDGDPCDLVDLTTIEELAGSTVAETVPDDVLDFPRCVYRMTSGARVWAGSTDARIWAAEVPAALEIVEQSGLLQDESTASKVDAIRDQLAEMASLDNEEACAVFSDFVEIQGAGAGQSEVVNFVPDALNPLVVNGQRCRDGVYSTVQLHDEAIADDIATYDRITTALDAVHEAGVEATS